MDRQTVVKMLDECGEIMEKSNRSEIIREGIELHLFGSQKSRTLNGLTFLAEKLNPKSYPTDLSEGKNIIPLTS